MSGRYALDTNAVIALVDGNVSMRNLVTQAGEIFLPSPVLGELFYGAYRSGRVPENVERVDDLVQWYKILRIDETTAKTYGQLRHNLQSIGRPIPDNDLWIAALAQQHDLVVITQDDHFNAIGRLNVVCW